MLKKANDFSPGSLELVDAHAQLPHLKKRRGISSWPVMFEKSSASKFPDIDHQKVTDLFDIYHTYS